MKKMRQFPTATSANSLLMFAIALISLCAAHTDDFTENRSVNHAQNTRTNDNFIVSNETENTIINIKSPLSPSSGSALYGGAHHPHLATTKEEDNIKSASDDDMRNFASPHSSSKHTRVRRSPKNSIQQISICSICKCSNNPIVDVECHLTGQEIKFDNQYQIPREARSLTVHLNKSRLIVERNFFEQNIINRFLVVGSLQSHVEFMQNALTGNQASNLAIDIVNVDTVALKNGTFHGEIKLNITNCNNVIIQSGALSQTDFVNVFDSIKDLRMEENALNGGQLSRVSITNCHIDRLEKIGKKMKEVKILNSKISKIATHAFDFSNIDSLILENTNITTIEPRAFSAGTFCYAMFIKSCHINRISSEAIPDCGFNNITIVDNTIDNIEKNGIYATVAKAQISFNIIRTTDHHWLRLKDFSNIEFNNNSFGHFSHVNLQERADKGRCEFVRNSITTAEDGSMRLAQNCTIKDVLFSNLCTDCNLKWLKKLAPKNFESLRDKSYCSVDQPLKYCFNNSIIKVTTYYREVCSNESTKIDCIKAQQEPKVEVNFIKPDKGSNGKTNMIMIIIIIVISAIILFLLVTILIVCVRRKTRRHDQAELITASAEHSHHSTERVPKALRIFTPEDRLIINQTLEKMKTKHPPEKYDQVYNNTQKLMTGGLTESEKVLTIGEVVRTLSECENTGEDFVAFTDILYKHLAPKDSNQNDPVYAEPNLIPSNDHDDRTTQLDLNHIYAEPNSVQQPLLNNEYAFPVDRNTDSGHYTEPVLSAKDQARMLISPYAIGGTNGPPLGGGSAAPSNLPDVLSQSTTPASSEPPLLPQGNVQRIANAFANNPNFHITRSPRSNRTIPKYTIPGPKERSLGKRSASSSKSDVQGAPSVHKKDSTSSDHSGGSDITVKIDDVIDYADA
ncbi:uncharacterized protein DMENIID0001_038250 [Sergentomyia squamirostris]